MFPGKLVNLNFVCKIPLPPTKKKAMEKDVFFFSYFFYLFLFFYQSLKGISEIKTLS